MITIEESGMTFGCFDEDSVYQIETSPYLNTLEHIKIAEFIVLHTGKKNTLQLRIVEAKSSIPRERDKFYADIKSKLLNSLTLLIAGHLKRHQPIDKELPENFKCIDWATIDIKLLLVIPDIPDQHLPPMTDKFRKNFITECKLWNIPNTSILVLNKEKASRMGLIQ